MSFEASDKEQLITAMMKLGNGIYEDLDLDGFEDREIAEAYNSMIRNVAKRNNNYLMRTNQAMEKIGNASWLKEMFEIIDSQQGALMRLQECEGIFDKAMKEIDDNSVRALSAVCQIDSNIAPVIGCMDEIAEELKQAQENGCSAKQFEKIITLIELNQLSVRNMKQNMDDAINELKDIYDAEKKKSDIAEPIVSNIKLLEETCSALSIGCINTGRHMHSISRLVDNVRNDMFRGNTDPTMRDALRIYEIDHLVLTWRLYNHVMEYEVLRIEQLNNKDRCKFGVWANMTSPRWIRETDEFMHAYTAHDEMHLYAVSCFEACENMNRVLALQEFEKMLEALGKFRESLEEVHSVLVRKGMSEETGTLEGNIF